MHTALLASVALVASLMGSAAQASIAYDNGAPGQDSRWCDSGIGQCGGGGNWTIVDNFTLNTKSEVTGLDTWNANGNIADYVSTNWSIWSSQPTGLNAPIASGNSKAAITADSGFILATLSGLSVTLEAGNYWIGFNHQLSGSTPWTYVTSTSGLSTVIQLDGDKINTTNQLDAAFRIHAMAVPEPGTGLLIAMGLVAIGLVCCRRSAT